jgi:glutamyl-tRNA reductase
VIRVNDRGVITGVSVSHRRANVDEIESACHSEQRTLVGNLLARDGVSEAFALQTCNRAEAYVVTDSAVAGRESLEDFAPAVREGAVVHMDHEESIRHLMRVAAGLESLVIGEDQIMGQLREAVEDARAGGGIGPTLEEALLKSIHVGERARNETAINEGSVSLGSAAVELAQEESTVEDAVALVVGAGELGTLAARALADAGARRVVIANRTVPHAERVADELEVPASAVAIDAAPEVTAQADIVITATGAPGHVLDAADLRDSGETLVIDVAQPRDVDPDADDLAGVTVDDIDALRAVTDRARQRRRKEAAEVEALIDAEFDRLIDAYKRKRADAAISRMYESAERVKQRELEQAVTKLESQGDLTAEQRETVESLADALVGQLLAAPTKSLREAAGEDDWTTIQTAMQLFNPEFESEPASPESPQTLEENPEADVPQEVVERLSEE